MRKPDRPDPRRPDVIDLNARRRVNELKKAATKSAGRRRSPDLSRPAVAWGLLLLAALILALIRWLPQVL
jgi:hypothetical protein